MNILQYIKHTCLIDKLDIKCAILGFSQISPGLSQPAKRAFCFSANGGKPSGSTKSIGRADTVRKSERSLSLQGK